MRIFSGLLFLCELSTMAWFQAITVEFATAALLQPGDHCDPVRETEFVQVLALYTGSDLEWTSADPRWNSVCNMFQYYRCDNGTQRCVCCNNADNKLYWDQTALKCRIKIGGQCLPNGSPNPVYGLACFTNPVHLPLPAFTPVPPFPQLVECQNGTYISKVEQLTGHLLAYGANDLANDLLPRRSNGLGQGTPCNYQDEQMFLSALKLQPNDTDFLWLQLFSGDICNVFKYLKCDLYSGKCICWHPDLFWAPDEIVDNGTGSFDYGQFKGRCRVGLNHQDSCTIDRPVHEVLPKYKKPHNLDIFDNLIDPVGTDYEIMTVDSQSLRCVRNSWNHFGHYECDEGKGVGLIDLCKSERYYLIAEMNLWRQNGGNDAVWSFPPNDLCEEDKQDYFLRANELITWDFDRIRDIIILRETRDYCNPFIHQVCYRGVCACQRPIPKRNLTHGQSGERYAYRNNECVPEEGITCSRRYWHNGNWVDFLDECDVSLQCVLAPDGLNHVCCDPDALKVNMIPIENKRKGRCRDQLLGYNEPSARIDEATGVGILSPIVAATTALTMVSGNR